MLDKKKIIVYNKNRRKPIQRLTPVKIMVFTRGTPVTTVFSFPLAKK
nr:MAG TPA: hypothetical protein [Caudoviricetes sp.]